MPERQKLRLGVPKNIRLVRGVFVQPREKLNPLLLRFRAPITIELIRADLGGSSFIPFWSAPVFIEVKQLLPRCRLILMLRKISKLFEKQVEPWQAFDYDGNHQPLVDEEIRQQLQAYGRRHPEAQSLLAG